MIISLQNNQIKDLIKLKQKKHRTNLYLVEGFHIVEEALKANKVKQIITTLEHYDFTDVLYVSNAVMEKLAFTKSPQPIMAVCCMDDVVEIADVNRTLILDDLQDPGNVGTLIRSALAFGYKQVLLSNQSVDIYNDKALRSMQGAHFYIPCHYVNIEEAIITLQTSGTKVVASALENGKDIACIDASTKMAIVLGNEGNGMQKEHIEMCDEVGYIPIQKIESLNVAVAGGIMMHYFML